MRQKTGKCHCFCGQGKHGSDQRRTSPDEKFCPVKVTCQPDPEGHERSPIGNPEYDLQNDALLLIAAGHVLDPLLRDILRGKRSAGTEPR
jgi:hypothetical protein